MICTVLTHARLRARSWRPVLHLPCLLRGDAVVPHVHCDLRGLRLPVRALARLARRLGRLQHCAFHTHRARALYGFVRSQETHAPAAGLVCVLRFRALPAARLGASVGAQEEDRQASSPSARTRVSTPSLSHTGAPSCLRRAILAALEKDGVKVIAAARVAPIISDSAINYLFGASR